MTIQTGSKYRHYKGKEYTVVALAVHTETLEDLVIYRDDSENFWARPKKMFLEKVEVDGQIIDRFTLIGPQ